MVARIATAVAKHQVLGASGAVEVTVRVPAGSGVQLQWPTSFLVDDPDIDGVLIAAPARSHAEPARRPARVLLYSDDMAIRDRKSVV